MTGSLWSNIELGRYDGAPDLSESGGSSAFNVAELDPSLELGLPLREHTLAVGVDGFVYLNDTGYTSDDDAAEVFVRLDLALPGSPSLGLWRDVTQIDGSYLELSLAHSFALAEVLSLDLFAAVGASLSQAEDLRSDGSARKPGNFANDGFTHCELGVALPFAWRSLMLQPSVHAVVAGDPWVELTSATRARDVKLWVALSISGASHWPRREEP